MPLATLHNRKYQCISCRCLSIIMNFLLLSPTDNSKPYSDRGPHPLWWQATRVCSSEIGTACTFAKTYPPGCKLSKNTTKIIPLKITPPASFYWASQPMLNCQSNTLQGDNSSPKSPRMSVKPTGRLNYIYEYFIVGHR
jgi:hypothetical protein